MTQLYMTRLGTRKGQARKSGDKLGKMERHGRTLTHSNGQELTGTDKDLHGQTETDTDR